MKKVLTILVLGFTLLGSLAVWNAIYGIDEMGMYLVKVEGR
jgi:hypothetical protein